MSPLSQFWAKYFIEKDPDPFSTFILRILANMKMHTKSIVLFGDSLLGRFGKALIDKLEVVVKDITVYNCAAGGLNTQDGIRRADFIAKLKPDFVIFSFGANDCAPWKKQVPEKDFEKNYDSIIKSFSGSKMIVFPCPPANDPKDTEGTKQFNEILSRYNKIVYSVAKNNGVMLIDSEKVYNALLTSGNDYHEEDGLHLNDNGYAVFIKEVSALIS